MLVYIRNKKQLDYESLAYYQEHVKRFGPWGYWRITDLKVKDPKRFKFRSGFSDGYWLPNVIERQACCEAIKKPDTNNSWSLREHCKRKKHVQLLVNNLSPAQRSKLKAELLPLVLKL
jgi:hypothetical protein